MVVLAELMLAIPVAMPVRGAAGLKKKWGRLL